jgi:hypothetical protein
MFFGIGSSLQVSLVTVLINWLCCRDVIVLETNTHICKLVTITLSTISIISNKMPELVCFTRQKQMENLGHSVTA